MSESKRPWFLFCTNNALLLAIAELPVLVNSWKTNPRRKLSSSITYEDDDVIVSTSIGQRIKMKKPVMKNYPTIMAKLASIPEGFSPCLNGWRIHTVLKEEVLEFKSVHLKKKDYPSNNPQNLLRDVIRVWDNGDDHMKKMMKKDSKIKSYFPKRRTNSVLRLVSVDGSEDKAHNIDLLWELWQEIMNHGNDYARTPICHVVSSVLEDRKRLIFRKLKKKEEK